MTLRKKLSYEELVEQNKEEIRQNEQSMDDIDRKLEEKHKKQVL